MPADRKPPKSDAIYVDDHPFHRRPVEKLRKFNISAWFTQEEKESLVALAKADSRTASSWAREILLREVREPQKGKGKAK